MVSRIRWILLTVFVGLSTWSLGMRVTEDLDLMPGEVVADSLDIRAIPDADLYPHAGADANDWSTRGEGGDSSGNGTARVVCIGPRFSDRG